MQHSQILTPRWFSIALQFPAFSSTLDLIMESHKDPEGHLKSKTTCFLYVIQASLLYPSQAIIFICNWHTSMLRMWSVKTTLSQEAKVKKEGTSVELIFLCTFNLQKPKLSDCKHKLWPSNQMTRAKGGFFSLFIPTIYSIFEQKRYLYFQSSQWVWITTF